MNFKSKETRPLCYERRPAERGAALATSLILLVLMGVIAASIVAVTTSEVSVTSHDLQRTRAEKAAEAGLEHMTNKFSDLFSKTNNPTPGQLATIANTPPPGLAAEGFVFTQTLDLDQDRLAAYRARQGGSTSTWPTVILPPGSNAFAGLYASLVPYKMRSKAHFDPTSDEVTLEREINNYLIPLFQFGMFSDEDIELHPGPPFNFNGRVHANGNLYVNGDVTFLNKVTTASELVNDVLRNGSARTGANVRMVVGTTVVQLTDGSVNNGPNYSGVSGARGYHPGSPGGSANGAWDGTSILPAQAGVQNRFGGQLLTRSTGVSPLKLPLQLGGNPTRELIKRRMPNDDSVLREGRYHTKAQVRILIDDENLPVNASGIPAGRGVELGETATTDPYYFKPMTLGGGKALWQVSNSGSYTTNALTALRQGVLTGPVADTVRNVRNPGVQDKSAANVKIPGGAGVRGRVYIELVRADGTTVDVTRPVLSMGMTVGEPNAIVCLQRPLWAAFVQGSRDRTGGTNDMAYLVNSTVWASDGEIKAPAASTTVPTQDTTGGFLKSIQDDELLSPLPLSIVPVRSDAPPALNLAAWDNVMWNSIVPINVYNVREGWTNAALSNKNVFERGITSVVEINMRNLVRWLDGAYDGNLLSGTLAASGSIDSSDGYVVYVSDRRGDRVKQEQDPTNAVLTTTNGMVDNEDIYGPNNILDPGEDVIDAGRNVASGQLKKGTLQRDLNELPDPAAFSLVNPTTLITRTQRAHAVSAWQNPANFFRRSVRLFNGDNLRTTGATGKLSATKGLTVASENMVYIWGNYNTTGINAAPAAGTSSLNDPAKPSYYLGNQVPTSIVADAFFPLSKTWYDAMSPMFPEGGTTRLADASLPGVTEETSVRAAIIAGNNLSAMQGSPDAGNAADSRLSGGMHNFPRFLEDWVSQNRRWNFVGSFVPLYRSTQAVGQWNYAGTYVIYGAPLRNWAFDISFTDPARLPPGTPTFQYVEPTGFRQVINQ